MQGIKIHYFSVLRKKKKQQLKNDVRKADTLPKVLDTSVMQNPDSAVGFSLRTN